MYRGEIEAAARRQERSEIVVCFRRVPVERERPFVLAERFFFATYRIERVRQAEVDAIVAWCEARRFREVTQRFIEPSAPLQRQPEVVMRLRVIRPEPQRLAQFPNA